MNRCHSNRLIGVVRIDFPFISALFGMVLYAIEGVPSGFYGSHKRRPLRVLAISSNVEEFFQYRVNCVQLR
jgi:hypothetical protein